MRVYLYRYMPRVKQVVESVEPGVEVGVLATVDEAAVVEKVEDVPVMVDVGFANARGSTNLPPTRYGEKMGMLLRQVIRRARTRDIAVVLPDVLGSATNTREASTAALRVLEANREVSVMYVVHEVGRPIREVLGEASEMARVIEGHGFKPVIAVPTHVMDLRGSKQVPCGRNPILCTRVAEALAREYRRMGLSVHLLGPPLRVAAKLRHVVDSIDSSSYTRAPNNELRDLVRAAVARKPEHLEAFAAYWVLKAVGREREASMVAKRLIGHATG